MGARYGRARERVALAARVRAGLEGSRVAAGDGLGTRTASPPVPHLERVRAQRLCELGEGSHRAEHLGRAAPLRDRLRARLGLERRQRADEGEL
jgi:hypothetical protein